MSPVALLVLTALLYLSVKGRLGVYIALATTPSTDVKVTSVDGPSADDSSLRAVASGLPSLPTLPKLTDLVGGFVGGLGIGPTVTTNQ